MATINAASVSRTDVQSAVTSAVDGDTIVIPIGTASWTTGITVSKALTFQGTTTITNAGQADSNNDPTATWSDGTVIIDDCPAPNAQANNLFYINATNTRPINIGNVTVQGGASNHPNGFIANGSALFKLAGSNGNSPNLRIHDVHFDHAWRYHVYHNSNNADVEARIDHCVAEFNSGTSENWYIRQAGYGGYTNGDGMFIDDHHYGSDKFVTFEDCTLLGPDTNRSGTIDGTGRVRVRHCYLKNCGVSIHGWESGYRFQGNRVVEVSDNIFWSSVAANPLIRGGSSRYWNNKYVGPVASTPGQYPQLTAYRQFGTFPWDSNFGYKGANGESPWDLNASSDGVTPVAVGSPGYLFASGTYTGAKLTNKLVVTGIGQYVGYSVTNITTGKFSFATSSPDSNTLIFHAPFVGNLIFNSGDGYAIRKVITSLQQAGWGKGDDQITGNPAVNARTGTPLWTTSHLEPCYEWNNTENGVPIENSFYSGLMPTIQENREFYNYTTAFDGSSGVGQGLRSARPSNCTTGVGYWATDEQTFYVCDSTNHWTTDFVARQYPDPIGGGPYAPIFTSDLSANFGVNSAASFTVVTLGNPTAALSKTGALPTGVTFTDNSNGTATIAGTATTTVGSPWSLDISATNNQGTTHQTFVLTIGAGTKIIGLSGNMAFGNVITNTSATATLRITNTGTTDLGVTSVTYPTGYSGAYSGTIPAGTYHDVVVTFAPTLVQSYNGSITVNSDKTSGTNTIAVTGIGSAPPETSTPHPDRERSVARRVVGIGRRT